MKNLCENWIQQTLFPARFSFRLGNPPLRSASLPPRASPSRPPAAAHPAHGRRAQVKREQRRWLARRRLRPALSQLPIQLIGPSATARSALSASLPPCSSPSSPRATSSPATPPRRRKMGTTADASGALRPRPRPLGSPIAAGGAAPRQPAPFTQEEEGGGGWTLCCCWPAWRRKVGIGEEKRHGEGRGRGAAAWCSAEARRGGRRWRRGGGWWVVVRMNMERRFGEFTGVKGNLN
jgi:hypothetical protein